VNTWTAACPGIEQNRKNIPPVKKAKYLRGPVGEGVWYRERNDEDVQG